MAESTLWTSLDNFSTDLSGVVSADDHEKKADAINKLSARVIEEAPLHVNWPEYGGVGDGATDNTPAIQSAVDAMPAEGGKILFGAGDYHYFDTVNLDDITRGVTLLGNGGYSVTGTNIASTTLTYKGTGTGISAKSSHGFTCRDMWLRFDDASHSGSMIDLAHSATAQDSQYATFERCLFGSGLTSIQGTGNLVSLDKAINTQFVNCNFVGGNVAVKGAASGSYSNNNRFFGCHFARFAIAPIRNPTWGWSFTASTFQQLTSGAAGAIVNADSTTCRALCIVGGGCYDANTSGTWLDVAVRGLGIYGFYFGAGATGLNIQTNGNGVHVSGCQFDTQTTGINIVSPVTAADLRNNNWVACTTNIAGLTNLRDSTYRDPADAKLKYIDTAGVVNALY